MCCWPRLSSSRRIRSAISSTGWAARSTTRSPRPASKTRSALECAADDQFGDDLVGGVGEAESQAEIDVEPESLEVDDGEHIVTLPVDRREIPDRTDIGVVFDAQHHLSADIVGEPQRWSERRRAAWAEVHIDDRVDDEFPTEVAHAQDRPQLQGEGTLGEARRLVAHLDIEAVEKLALGGVWRDEEIAELEAAGQEGAAR